MLDEKLDLKSVQIGEKLIPGPSATFLKLHELTCRIAYHFGAKCLSDFDLKAAADVFAEFSDEDDDQVDPLFSGPQMCLSEKMDSFFEKSDVIRKAQTKDHRSHLLPQDSDKTLNIQDLVDSSN